MQFIVLTAGHLGRIMLKYLIKATKPGKKGEKDGDLFIIGCADCSANRAFGAASDPCTALNFCILCNIHGSQFLGKREKTLHCII